MFNHITALFASQVWSLFSAPTFFIPVFLIFLFGEDQPSQLSPLPVFCSTRLCLCVLWDQNLVINSIIRSFTRLLTLSLAYLTVNENPPIILFPSEFLPRCFGSFASSLFFCTFRCPPWAFPHTHTTCSLEKPIHILHNSAQISPHSFIWILSHAFLMSLSKSLSFLFSVFKSKRETTQLKVSLIFTFLLLFYLLSNLHLCASADFGLYSSNSFR